MHALARVGFAAATYPLPRQASSGPGTSPFLFQPAWFVDPQNFSGNASNINSGATASVPLLTKAELLRRIGAQNGSIQVPMSVTFLSEELPGQGTTDEIAIDTALFSLVWTMPTTVVASGTLTAATPKNRAAGVAGRQTVSGPNINTNVGLIFEDTSFTPSAQSYIRASAGGTTAVICSLVEHVDPTPLNPFLMFANAQVDPVAGNTYRVLRPGRLNMAFAEAVNGFGGALVFVDAAFHGDATFAEQFIGTCYTAFCTFANFYIPRVAEGSSPAATNCFTPGGGFGISEGPTSIPFYEGGAMLSQVAGAFFFDGDVLLQGSNGLQDGSSFSLACLENFFVVGFRSTGGSSYYVVSGDYGPPILWGDRLFVYSASNLFWQWDRTAVQTFLLASLHIEANGPIPGGSMAFAVDIATGNKAAAPSLRAVTAANLDTPVSLGGFAMGDPGFPFGPTGAGYAVGCSNGAIIHELA